MNLPGRGDGNWRWRFAASDLTPELGARLRAITEGSGRCPARERAAALGPPPARSRAPLVQSVGQFA